MNRFSRNVYQITIGWWVGVLLGMLFLGGGLTPLAAIVGFVLIGWSIARFVIDRQVSKVRL